MPFNSVKLIAPADESKISKLIAERIGVPLTESHVERSSSDEVTFTIGESLRNHDVYVISQIGSGDVNDRVLELLIMINAAKTASAGRITAVIPNFPYARQDKRDKSRAPITAQLMADMLVTAGCDHVVTMDLHAPQIQGFFDIPLDNLFAEPCIVRYIRESTDYNNSNTILVSPDAGFAKRVAELAEALKLSFAIIHKERAKANEVSRMLLVGDVRGKTCIILDDMADTCGTLIKASELLLENHASKVNAIVTHGILSGNAVDKVNKSRINKLVCTNTVEFDSKVETCPKLEIIDISGELAESIRRLHNGESVSYLFKNHDYV